MESESSDIDRCIIQLIVVLIKLLPGEVDLDLEVFILVRCIIVFECLECLEQILKCRKDLL
jgi:hypothetical protein